MTDHQQIETCLSACPQGALMDEVMCEVSTQEEVDRRAQEAWATVPADLERLAEQCCDEFHGEHGTFQDFAEDRRRWREFAKFLWGLGARPQASRGRQPDQHGMESSMKVRDMLTPTLVESTVATLASSGALPYPVAVLLVELDGAIAELNTAACRLLGEPREALIRRHAPTALGLSSLRWQALCEAAAQTGSGEDDLALGGLALRALASPGELAGAAVIQLVVIEAGTAGAPHASAAPDILNPQPDDRDLIVEIIHDLDHRVLQAQAHGCPQEHDQKSAALRRLLERADDYLGWHVRDARIGRPG